MKNHPTPNEVLAEVLRNAIEELKARGNMKAAALGQEHLDRLEAGE